MSANRGSHLSRFERQAEQYDFPYHWLPEADSGTWSAVRALPWGFEYLAYLNVVVDLTLSRQPRKVLDFGCGDGRVLAELAAAGVDEVVGIDLVDSAIQFARGFAASGAGATKVVQGDVAELAEADFDVVVAMETFEHIADGDLSKILRALWDRTRAEGWLVVSVPTTNMPLNPKHERHYDAATLKAQLSPLWEVDRIQYVHRLSPASKWLRRVLVNRVFALTSRPALHLATSYYKARLMTADARDGAHIVALCRKATPTPTAREGS